jgi:hypothetical protein
MALATTPCHSGGSFLGNRHGNSVSPRSWSIFCSPDEKKSGESEGRKRKEKRQKLTTSLHERKDEEEEMHMRVRFVNFWHGQGEV